MVNRVAVAVLLLGLFGVAGCGGEDQVGDPPKEPPRSPGGEPPPTIHEEERELRQSQYVTLYVAEKDPSDASSGLVVRFAGTLYPDGVRRMCTVHVAGRPVAIEDDGRFQATRVFPKAGTYIVSAVVTKCAMDRPDAERSSRTTECRVSVTSSEDESEHIKDLSRRVVGSDGVVNVRAFKALASTRDLRIVPVLWQVLETNPGTARWERQHAAFLMCDLPHLDSIPRLIPMLKDPGVFQTVEYWLRRLLVDEFTVNETGFPPTSDEMMLDAIVERFRRKFQRAEPRLRRELCQ